MPHGEYPDDVLRADEEIAYQVIESRFSAEEIMRTCLLLACYLASSLPSFADPSCVDPVNLHYVRDDVDQSCVEGVCTVYSTYPVFGYTCGNGAYYEEQGNVGWTALDMQNWVIAANVDAYSGNQKSIETWDYSTQTGLGSPSRWIYHPENFQIQLVFPKLSSSIPFDGSKDDPGYLDFLNKSPFKNKSRAALKITYLPDPNYQAMIFVFPGKGDLDYFNNPIIVGDAFDPTNGRDAWNIYTNQRSKSLLSISQDNAAVKNHPRDMGYDVWFADFSQGGGDILINAGIELKLIEWMHSQTNSKMIVGGPSMSGIVARLALLLSDPSNNNGKDYAPRVKGYISIDSPHQGASIAPSLQKAVNDAATNTSINTLVGFADLFTDAKNDAKDQWKQLSVPAAHQMLYGHYYPNESVCCLADGSWTHSFSNASRSFYEKLRSMGDYRKGMPKVAIAYSNFFLPHQSINRSIKIQSGQIKVTSPRVQDIDVILMTRGFNAGGAPLPERLADFTGNDPEFHEFTPGSVGNWYFNYYANKPVSFVLPGKFYNDLGFSEHFKGTFVPIESALDLSPSVDLLSRPQPSDEVLSANTKFEKILYMKQDYNGYSTFNPNRAPLSNQDSREDQRYEHIIFDDQLMETLAQGLRFIEGRHAAKTLPTILSLLQ